MMSLANSTVLQPAPYVYVNNNNAQNMYQHKNWASAKYYVCWYR